MKHLRKRLLAVFLAGVMTVTSVGTASYAYEAEKKGNLSVTGKDGKTIEEEESWEEKFPNGTFAFKNDSITIEEGKNAKEQKITIYRLGGTKGKATAKVAITPAVAALDEEEKELVYANAASNKDYTVKVENPIGADGTIGKQQVSSSYDIVSKKENQKVTLSLKDVKGDYVRYFWHVKKDGKWETAEGDKETLTVSEKEFNENEYVCVVEADYKLGLSKTTGEESSQKLWINVNSRHITDENTYEKGSYTDVTLDREMPFKTSFLQVDFEDGEWVKDIVVKATDDEEHEAEELASFTIYEVEGAAFTETANRLSMCIKDDEEKLESTMGFALSKVRVDKSTGKAKIKLTRTGATQYVSSVDYKTIDGSAKAGTDYAKASSTASFSGGIESTEIEVELLNDNKKTEEDRYFTIQLSNAKGGTIKKNAQEIRVDLFNTDTADNDNVATASKSTEAEDASKRVKEGKKAITQSGKNEIKVTPVKQKEQKVSYEETADDKADMYAQANTDFSYKISTKGLTSKWGRTANLTEEYTAYDSNSKEKSLTKSTLQNLVFIQMLKEDYRGNTYFEVGDLSNMYSGMSVKMNVTTNKRLYAAYNYLSGFLLAIGDKSFATSLTDYTDGSGDDNMKPRIESESKKAQKAIYSQYGSKSNQSVEKEVSFDDISDTGKATHIVLKSFITKRGDRVRDRETNVVSVNDFVLKRRNIDTAPTLNITTGNSGDMNRLSNSAENAVKTVKQGLKPIISLMNGGFNGDGKFYLGSELNVKQSDNTGVYKLESVQLKEGETLVADGKISDKSTTVKFTHNNRRMSTTASYSLNCVYNRYQNIKINCKTSMLDEETSAEKQKKLETIRKNIKVDGAGITWKTSNTDFSHNASDVKNFNKINFNLQDGTKILYNNKVYEGNADIPVSDKDLVANTVTFSVYTKDAVNVVREPEILAEKMVSLYKDVNKDGKYTAKEDGTEPIKILNPDEAYQITDFGKDILIKVDFDVQPACLTTPPGANANETFQVVPGFVTTQTSEEQKTKMTEEMKSYRDISTKDGTVKMYGTVTSGTVSFLSGYDASPAKMNTATNKYEWNPNWKGNLRTAFGSPEKIKVYETKMPNGFVAASTKSQINGYLGCLHGNETYYLTSRINEAGKEKITSTQRGRFYTVPEPAAQGFRSLPVSDAEAPEDDDNVTDKQPDVADTKPEVSLPSLNIGLGLGKFMMGKDEIGFSVGTPIFGASSQNGAGVERDILGVEGLKDMKKAMTSPSDNIFKQLRKQRKATDNNGNTGKAANATPLKGKSNKQSIDIAVNLSFVWKYSKLTGKYEFSSAMIALSIEGSVRLQYRFQTCPIFYVYVQVGIGLQAQTGIQLEKKEIDNGDETTSIQNEVSFAGLKMNPSLYVEAGAGFGVDLAKLEVYVKVSVSFAFTFNKKTTVDEFVTSAAVGFRAVFLFFSYEMDIIGCKGGYDRSRLENDKKAWFFSWQVVGMEMGSTGASEEVDSDVAGAPVSVSKPKNVFRMQNINSSDDNAARDDMTSQAYDIDGVDEFQVSGYGNNASAVELGSGFDSASDYKLLTVGDTNYVLYTISRKNPGHSLNNTQLVMSKLSTTSTGQGGEDGKEVMGLVNPIDAASQTKYIVVDRKAGAEEGTGDINYDAVVEGDKIKVTWTSYLESAAAAIPDKTEAQEMLKKASQMIEVKTAEFDASQLDEFTDAVVLSQNAGYHFLPVSAVSDVHLFVDTEPYTETEMIEREKEYKKKYDEDAKGNNADNKSGTGDPYAQANYEYALTTDYLYGKYSKLHYSVKQGDGTYQTYDLDISDEWKDQKTRYEDVQFAAAEDNSYYLSYVTEQKDQYGSQKEDAKIKKLYVQKATVETVDVQQTEEEKLGLKFGRPVLLKTLVDYDDSDEQDGIYVEGAQKETLESPNFSNLKFLHGKLSANGQKETFLLYNVNGITYVIEESSLKNALESTTEPIIEKPLFETDEEQGESQTEATIGTDGDGNISAVYTQTVPNTVNNALYVTKYDPEVGKFGKPFMLAMNHMQVYENSISQNMSSEEAQKAFYDTKQGGGEDQFIFNSPQIAIGKPTSDNENGTLTILTKGTMTKLQKTTVQFEGKDYTEYVPETTQGSMQGSAGIYAISYGVGKQKIGEASISFEKNDFVAGQKLTGSVSFRNTGDVAIRASEANPAYITLKASTKSGSKSELGKWKVESNILAGQQVTTDAMEMKALPGDIAGGFIYFEVQENPGYSQAKAISTIKEKDGQGKIEIGEKAELSIENVEITAGDTLEKCSVNNISCIMADVEMTVKNKGVKAASDVTFEVKHTSGKTDNKTDGKTDRYIPLEINGKLITSSDGKETPLLGNGKSGVFDYLGFTNAGNTKSENKSIPAGITRTIKGRIAIPMTAFDPEDAIGAANLQFTMQSSTAEYEQKNNTAYGKVVPATRFDCLDKVSLTVGNPVNFNLQFEAALDISKRSNITLTEMKLNRDGNAELADNKILSNAAYNVKTGYVSVTAQKEGSGILRIADTTTGSFKDITFNSTISGCNICTDNEVFTFDNPVGGTEWKDEGVGAIVQNTILPYNNDICIGAKGNTFTFTTYARSIDFYYTGDIEVSSNNSFGYTTKKYKDADGVEEGKYYKRHTVDFKNTSLKKHTVTVKVLSNTASFDSMIEYYADRSAGDTGREIKEDETAPKIVIGKTRPTDVTKLQPGTVLEIPVYVYDNVMLNSVSIGGNGADTQVNNQFAKGILRIRKNGTYYVIAEDSFGNISTERVEIKQFEEEAEKTAEKSDDWPKVSLKLVDEAGKEITKYTQSSAYLSYDITAERKIKSVKLQKIDNMTTQAVSDIGPEITVSEETESLTDKYPVNITQNGYYKMVVEDMRGNATTEILCVELLSGGPKVSLYTPDGVSNQLFYCIGDETNEVPLSRMAVYEGNIAEDQIKENANGAFTVAGKTPLCSKSYTAQTMDSGTIDLKTSVSTKQFTIVAKDETGKRTVDTYSDATCLNKLLVGNLEEQKLGIKLSEEFKPYQKDYTVDIPYGYPELKQPDVYAELEPGKSVSGNWDGDVYTIVVKKGSAQSVYTVTLKRQICTCKIALRTYDDLVLVPSTGEKQMRQFDVQSDVTGCDVHKDHTQANVQYAYEVVSADYAAAAEGESASIETAAAESPVIENEVVEIQGDKIFFSRIPNGKRPVEIKVKVTAKTASCQESQIITYTVRNQYDMEMYVTQGGTVQCGEDMLTAQGTSGMIETPDTGDEVPYHYDTDTGFVFDLTAKEMPGYQFAGWYNSANEFLGNKKDFHYVVSKDEKLYARFKDVVDPTGKIELTDQSGTNNVMKSDEGDILVSSKGFHAKIDAQDNQSGIKSVSYQIVKQGENFDENDGWIEYNGKEVELNDEMDFVIYAKIVDKHDNAIIIQSSRAMIEKTAAKVILAPNFTPDIFTNKKDAAIVVIVQRGTAALKEIRYIVDGKETKCDQTTFGVDNLPDGIYEVEVAAKDIFGKEISEVVSVKKDTANPVLNIDGIPTTPVEKATLNIRAEGGLSGVKEVRVNGKPYAEKAYEVEENGTYVFELENNAGTVVAETVSIECIVKPTPTPIPTVTPTAVPTTAPTAVPTTAPTAVATTAPTTAPTAAPTIVPTPVQTQPPAIVPTETPTPKPSLTPSQPATGLPIPSVMEPPAVIKSKEDGNTVMQPDITDTTAAKKTLPITQFVRKKNIGRRGIRITWKGVKRAVSYNVYRSKKANGEYKLVANVKESAYISMKKNARKYYYKIVAVAKNHAYNSEKSAYAISVNIDKLLKTEAGTGAAAGADGKTSSFTKKVTGVKVKAGKGKMKVTWEKVKKADGYIVYRAESKYGVYDEFATVTTNSFRDIYVVKNRKFYYKIRPFKQSKGALEAELGVISKKTYAKAK